MELVHQPISCLVLLEKFHRKRWHTTQRHTRYSISYMFGTFIGETPQLYDVSINFSISWKAYIHVYSHIDASTNHVLFRAQQSM